jgi:6-phosphogluconolactonase
MTMPSVRKGFMLSLLVGLLSACGGGSSGSSSGNNTPAVSSITVGPASPSVVAGLTLSFTATAMYSDGSQKDVTGSATWASSATNIATISPAGMATGVAAGTSSVSASLNGVQGAATLTVTAAQLKSLAISPNRPTMAVGKTLQLKATGTFTDSHTEDLTGSVTWVSSDTTTAAFNNAASPGLLSGSNLGRASIGATAASGGISATAVTMTVIARTMYAYVTNFDAGTVSQYLVGNDGSLTPLATPAINAGSQPFSLTVEPTGQYVYVSNYVSATISQYKIGTDGGLSPIGSGSVMSGNLPNGVTTDHAERFAYVANLADNTVSQYKIGADGSLAALTIAAVAAGICPATVMVDPSNHFVYAASFGVVGPTPPAGPSTIYQYTIGADGSLTPVAAAPSAASGSGPNAMATDPAGKYLYVVNLGDNNVGQYTIGADGSLTAMATATVPAGTRPFDIAVDPSGKYAYVANSASNNISQYTIDPASGALHPMSTATVAAGSGVSGITVDPTGSYVYGTSRNTATISQYTIGADGSLTPMATATVAAGLNPTAIAIAY